MSSNYLIFCTDAYSPLEISLSLRHLRVSHTRSIRGETKFVDRKLDQPLPVHVTDNIHDFRASTVNFIVAAKAELATTNFISLGNAPVSGLDQMLIFWLTHPKSVKPKIRTLTPIDYVNQVAKPSLLNKIQTEVYKIQPYALRKQAQALVLDYLNSRISDRHLKQVMSNNLKLELILPMLLGAKSLRDAVSRLRSGKETVEEVGALTGYPTFELLYISKDRKGKESKK